MRKKWKLGFLLTLIMAVMFQMSVMAAGYSISLLDASQFFNGGGINYVYNGKTNSFIASKVMETDISMEIDISGVEDIM